MLCFRSVLGGNQWLGPRSPRLAWNPLAAGKEWLGPICEQLGWGKQVIGTYETPPSESPRRCQ